MSRVSRSWVHGLFALLGLAVWLINLYSLITGLTRMSVPEAVCAGAIFCFAPRMIWQSLQDLRRGQARSGR